MDFSPFFLESVNFSGQLTCFVVLVNFFIQLIDIFFFCFDSFTISGQSICEVIQLVCQNSSHKFNQIVLSEQLTAGRAPTNKTE
jgi:hypothetical protein